MQQLWIGKISELLVSLNPLFDAELYALVQGVSEKRKQSLLVGRALLKLALANLGFMKLEQSLPQIAYTALNKPYFVDVPVHFNLSHSHDFIALAVGDRPQGLDLELIDAKRRLREPLLRKVLLEPEFAYFTHLQNSEGVSYTQPTQQSVATMAVKLTASLNQSANTSELTALINSKPSLQVSSKGTLDKCTEVRNKIPLAESIEASGTAFQATHQASCCTSNKLNAGFSHLDYPAPIKQQAYAKADTVQPYKVCTNTVAQAHSELKISGAARDFFFMQWTVKECLLKLQGSSIFALNTLHFDPVLKTVHVDCVPQAQATKNAQDETICKARGKIPWFTRTFSYKLSSLYRMVNYLDFDWWLTLGVYEEPVQTFIFTKANSEQIKDPAIDLMHSLLRNWHQVDYGTDFEYAILFDD